MSVPGHNSAAFGEQLDDLDIIIEDGKKLFYYVQWHIGDYIAGTQGMTPEQEGIYMRFLTRLYDNGRPFPDDERYMALLVGLDIRKWRRVRNELVQRGKIIVRAGCLTNPRFEKERQRRAAELRKQADGTRKYWEKKRAQMQAENHTSDGSRGEVGAKSDGSPSEVRSTSGGSSTKKSTKSTEPHNTPPKHPSQETRDERLKEEERKKEIQASIEREAARDAGQIEGLNGASSLIVTKVAKWISPYQPDYQTARNWTTSTLALFGERVFRDSFADMETKMASGGIVGAPLKLFTKICQDKAERAAARAPASSGDRFAGVPDLVRKRIEADERRAREGAG